MESQSLIYKSCKSISPTSKWTPRFSEVTLFLFYQKTLVNHKIHPKCPLAMTGTDKMYLYRSRQANHAEYRIKCNMDKDLTLNVEITEIMDEQSQESVAAKLMADSGDDVKLFVPSDFQNSRSILLLWSCSICEHKSRETLSFSFKINNNAKDSIPPTSEEVSRRNLFEFTVHSKHILFPIINNLSEGRNDLASEDSSKDDGYQHILCYALI